MRSRVRYCMLVTSLLVAGSACGGDDPALNAPSSLPPVTMVSVNVDGPTRLAPGESAQFIATVNLSNFTTKSPASVRWLASPPSFLKVDAAGVATGGPFSGGAAITADVTQPNGTIIRKSLGVIVLPRNTFLVVGTVTDAELGVPVPGARVELTSGALSTDTDSAGVYRLYGVPLSAEIRVTAPGYQTVTQNLDLSGDSRQDFRLALSGPRLILSGNYTLTMEVTACSGGPPLPQSLRLRQYDAAITQSGIALQVVLTEPRFLVVGNAGNRFSGQVTATGATFTLNWNEDSHPNVVERLGDGSFLVAAGGATTTGSAAGLSGTLGGSLLHYGPGFPGTFNFLDSCDSPRFTLTPR
jgi:hypothetical protein